MFYCGLAGVADSNTSNWSIGGKNFKTFTESFYVIGTNGRLEKLQGQPMALLRNEMQLSIKDA